MVCESDLIQHLVVKSVNFCIKYCILHAGKYVTYDLISKNCWIYETCDTKKEYMFMKDYRCL